MEATRMLSAILHGRPMVEVDIPSEPVVKRNPCGSAVSLYCQESEQDDDNTLAVDNGPRRTKTLVIATSKFLWASLRD